VKSNQNQKGADYYKNHHLWWLRGIDLQQNQKKAQSIVRGLPAGHTGLNWVAPNHPQRLSAFLGFWLAALRESEIRNLPIR
jgi:hypothetical protein